MRPFVTVPDLQYGHLLGVYESLQKLGLRVSIRNSFVSNYVCDRFTVKQGPPAGTLVRRGSTVTFSVDGCMLGRGPISNLAQATVPDLVGRRVTAAWIWTYENDMFFEARLPPLRNGDRPRLYDNYRIVRQSPKAGSRLSRFPGVCNGIGCGPPTPLIVWGRQA